MQTWRVRRLLFIVFLSTHLFVSALHAGDDGGVRCKVGDPFLRTELFFGLSRPAGEVTEEEFQQFLAAAYYAALSGWLDGGHGTWAIQKCQWGHHPGAQQARDLALPAGSDTREQAD